MREFKVNVIDGKDAIARISTAPEEFGLPPRRAAKSAARADNARR